MVKKVVKRKYVKEAAEKEPQVMQIGGIATVEQIEVLRASMKSINDVFGDTLVRHGQQLKYMADAVAGIAKGHAEHSRKIDGVTKRLDKASTAHSTTTRLSGRYCVIGDKQSNCYTINRNWFNNRADAEDHARYLLRNAPHGASLYVVESTDLVTK